MTDYMDLLPMVVETSGAVMPEGFDSWGIKSVHHTKRSRGHTMIINTDHLWADDRRRLADMLAHIGPTDSLYPIACQLQDEAAAPTRMPDSRASRLFDRVVGAVLDAVEAIQDRRAVPADIWGAFDETLMCSCGHTAGDHEHLRAGTDCGLCRCVVFDGTQA